MLTKPLSHLRPLLRLPSHTPSQPEHFTPNPNLLHHLPQNGGHGVANAGQATQAASGPSAGAAGAGKSGWSAGAGGAGGGGYTGHARAFLSLAQSSSVEPSSSLVMTDDNSQQTSSRNASLLLKQRLGRQTRIVELAELPSGLRRAIEARAGAKLSVVDIEGEGRSQDDTRLLEGGNRTASPRRRSSIAFPSPSPRTSEITPPSSPRLTNRSRPSTPHSINQSSSPLDIFQVGIAQPRGSLSVRALSTRASPIPLPEVDEDVRSAVTAVPPSSCRTIPQPNRVLMDLAGLDVPTKRAGSLRRNHSLARDSGAVDDGVLASMAEQPNSDEADKKLWEALTGARQWGQKALIQRIVAHYRSPRSVSPFDKTGVAGDPGLANRLPLPAGYTVTTYNACLEALLSVRAAGESIAPILEIYNEMLERDMVPNGRTYAHVIRALCSRENDVSLAVSKWEEEKRWGRWRSEMIGAKWDPAIEEKKDGLVEGYVAEGNFASALKLFRAAVVLQHPQWRFSPQVYAHILNAASKQAQPDILTMIDVFRHSQTRDVNASRGLYHFMFRAYGKVGDKEGLQAMWDEFEAVRENGKGIEFREWFSGEATDQEPQEIRVQHFQRTAWHAAISAFVAVGETGKAASLLEQMISSPSKKGAIDLLAPPYPEAETFGLVMVALARKGQLDEAVQWHNRFAKSAELNHTKLQRYSASDLYVLCHELILSGRWRQAADILGHHLWQRDQPATFTPDRDIIRRLYIAMIAEAQKSSDEVATDILALIPKIIQSAKVIVDPSLSLAHLAVCERLGRYEDIISVLDGFMPALQGGFVDLRPTATRFLPHLSLSASTSFLRAYARQRQHPTPEIAEVVLTKYAEERATIPSPFDLEVSPDGWYRLVECVSRLSGPKFDEGEWDEVIERIVGDLSTLRSEKHDFLAGFENLPTFFTAFVDNIVQRFGADRTKEMLSPPFGEAKVVQQINRVGEGSVSVITGSEEALASEVFSIPPTLESATNLPYSPQPPSAHTIHVDPELSSIVDKHTARNPPITPLEAYNRVRAALTSHNAVPHIDSLSRLISSLGRMGDEAKVRELYNLAQVVLSSAVAPQHQASAWRNVEDAMLTASCFLGHLEQAGAHRARIVAAGMAPSADAYATMIASSKDTTDDALVARELFDESQALGVKPHLYLYNTIISKLSKARKAELALELFGHMKGARIRPSSVTYGAVINACCRVGDVESAETLFAEMASQPNFKPRVPPFNTMMQFYLQTVPSRERVLHYYQLLRASSVDPSAHTYKLLLDAFSTLQPVDLAAMEQVFADLVADRNVRVQGTHWASVITAHGIHAGDLSKALEIFDSIPSHPTSRGPIEAVVWEAILNVIAHRGTLDQLESMRQRMVDSHVQPTAYVYNVLIAGYARAGAIDRARVIFDGMGDSVVGVAAPNNHPTLLTTSGHVKPATVTGMSTGLVYREPSTYEIMVRAEVLAGERARAEEVLQRMEARRYPVAVYMRARAALDEQPTFGYFGAHWPVSWTSPAQQDDAAATVSAPGSATTPVSGSGLGSASGSGSVSP